jgi:polar amino acid transport system permease protein
MSQYAWDFAVVFRRWDILAFGLLNSLKLTGAAVAVAMPLGLALTFTRLAKIPVLSWLAVAYIDFFRTASALVLVFWFFFAFPILIGVDLDSFAAATLAISLQAAAFFAEIFRSGIQSIHKGQWEASKAIGMPRAMVMRHVILPQAFRRVVPVVLLRLIETLKISSLAAAISYAELTYNASRVAVDTYRPLETFTVVAAMYFVVIFIASQGALALERSLARSDR